MNKILILAVLMSVGCSKQWAEEREQRRLELQAKIDKREREEKLEKEELDKYVSSLPLENKVFMRSCLEHSFPATCIERMKSFGKASVSDKKTEALSTTDVAVGTAIGYGATRLLLDK